MCLCFDLQKMYVYTATGLLLDRVIYKTEAAKWGKPMTMSEDARYLIFRKSLRTSVINLV